MSERVIFSLLLLAAVLLAGCGGTKTVGGGEDSSASPFQRQITPFPVHDSAGTPLDHPFLGGYNVPRPQFVDIDGDGDEDLFVQENSNELIYFENVSPGAGSPLAWRSDRYRGLEIGEWYRFADMDGDGDFDLLAEQPYSHIRYYRNEGTPREPEFVLAADTLRDVDGEPIFSDRQNIPNVTDIDCDGRLDLFIGRLDGTVRRYESTGRDAREIPQFELTDRKFEGIEIVNQFGTLHGANTLTFADIEGDGDQDMFWGDFFEPSLLLIENRGSCGNTDLQGEPTPFPPSDPVASSGYNAPAFADWGGDGDLDLFVGVLGGAYSASRTLAKNFHFYERGPDGSFTLQTRRFLSMIDIGNESMPAAGDVDGDGDTDLLLANKIDPADRNTSVVYRYENSGGAGAPSFRRAGRLDLPEAYHYAPVLGDVDGDGRDDLLLGTWRGRIAYYRSTGEGFESVSENLIEVERGSNIAPALGDLDDDGDLDLLAGESGGGVRYYRNEGTSREPEFVPVEEAFPGVRADRRSVPALHDIDGDGDLDLFLGSQSGGLLFFRNSGSAGRPEFEREPLPAALDVPALSSPIFADVDGDGEAEFLSGGEGGGLVYYDRPNR